MKNIYRFSLHALIFSALLISCGEVENNPNTGDLSSSSEGESLPGNSSATGISSSGGNVSGYSNWKVEKAEKVAFQYDPQNGSYNLVFQDMKIEDVAIASLSAENICGIRYDHGNYNNSDKVEFFINDKLHYSEVLHPFCVYLSLCEKEYSEAFPCGSYTFTWKITKLKKDGIPAAIANSITRRPVKDTAYAPDFSFEAGWATDLQADGWYLNNRDKYQGSYSINAGWMRDEEIKEMRIKLPDTATKLNLYYRFSDSAPSTSYRDSAYISIGDRVWKLSINSSWTKFSTVLRSQDSIAAIKFIKREDGFSSFFVDDIRTLRYEPSAQADRLWDFEDSFYPAEISGDWWIDNSDAYQGEYSLRAPLDTTGICGFDIDVGLADSVSLWNKCSYLGKNPQIRIGTSEDFIACECIGSWKECKFPTREQNPLHIETDCVSGYERRIDHLKAW